MSTENIKAVTSELARVTSIGVAVGAAMMLLYLAFEPVISRAITDQFTVRQEVTGEVAFATPASDVVLLPAIASITGGTSTGGTQVRVTTNTSGLTMDIDFTDTVAMQGETTSGTIANYTETSPGTPDYEFTIAAGAAEFAYTIAASNTDDVDSTFWDDNGSNCAAGATGNATIGNCWMGPSTTAERIIDASSVPTSGSTSTIGFQLVVTPNASGVPSDWYNATATLTALVN